MRGRHRWTEYRHQRRYRRRRVLAQRLHHVRLRWVTSWIRQTFGSVNVNAIQRATLFDLLFLSFFFAYIDISILCFLICIFPSIPTKAHLVGALIPFVAAAFEIPAHSISSAHDGSVFSQPYHPLPSLAAMFVIHGEENTQPARLAWCHCRGRACVLPYRHRS